MAQEIFYAGQILLKRRPDDRTQLIEVSKKQSIALAKQYAELIKKENLTSKEKNKLTGLIERIRGLSEIINLPSSDDLGLDHFWVFKQYTDEEVFSIITLPNYEGDCILMNRYKSLDRIGKEFRTLDNVVKNEQLIGRLLSSTSNPTVYIMYELESYYVGLTIMNNAVCGPAIVYKTKKEIKFSDKTIPELNNPKILYKAIDRLKGNRL